MFQDSPIYDRLVAERGDVPAVARREAERVRRELEYVMRPFQPLMPPPAPERPASPARDGCPPPFPRPAALLTRLQDTVLFAPLTQARCSGPGRASHSAMLRAIGWPVSTSTKPNCPDWLHSRNHQVPSPSSAKSKAP